MTTKRYVIAGLFVAVLTGPTWGQCRPDRPDSVYTAEDYGRFPLQILKDRVISGRILCLGPNYCTVELPSGQPRFWDVDVAGLPIDERIALALTCTDPRPWGCKAEFALESQDLHELKLTSLHWDKP